MWFGCLCVCVFAVRSADWLWSDSASHAHSLHTGLFLATVALLAQPLCSAPPPPPQTHTQIHTYTSTGKEKDSNLSRILFFFLFLNKYLLPAAFFISISKRRRGMRCWEEATWGTDMQVHKWGNRVRRGEEGQKSIAHPPLLHPYSFTDSCTHLRRYWYVCVSSEMPFTLVNIAIEQWPLMSPYNQS